MDEHDQTAVTDEQILAYMRRQLGSGRVKPAVLLELTQQAFPQVPRERILRRFDELDSPLLKR